MGKYTEAVKLIMERAPIPGTLGRICPHPCEEKCRRQEVDEPLAISGLEAVRRGPGGSGDHQPAPGGGQREKIAIIGSGPAGLTCAYHLALQGYRPTIFEALPEPGGMLRVGIPQYRLPREVVQKEIDNILRLGVELKTQYGPGEGLHPG